MTGWYYVAIFFDPPYAKTRRLICSTCAKNKWNVCSVCGCPLVAKCRVKDEKCPIDRW